MIQVEARRIQVLLLDCQAEATTELQQKLQGKDQDVDKYEPNISQVEARQIHVLLPDCQAEATTELQQKLQGKDQDIDMYEPNISQV